MGHLQSNPFVAGTWETMQSRQQENKSRNAQKQKDKKISNRNKDSLESSTKGEMKPNKRIREVEWAFASHNSLF